MALSFAPWHGQSYKRFNIFVKVDGRTRHLGRMLAPNEELALIKARENFPEYPSIYVVERKRKNT